jgi:hypothetical protein
MGGLAWGFEIRKRIGSDGCEVPVPRADYTSLLIAKPRKFAFDAIVRGEARRVEMERMFISAVGEDEAEAAAGPIDDHVVGRMSPHEAPLTALENLGGPALPGSWA